MSLALIETVRCNWCTKSRPRWQVHRLSNQQAICDYCFRWHLDATDFLAGKPPKGCQECQRDWGTIQAETCGLVARMFVVPKDGYLQMLCARCIAPYLPKTKELYKGTKFGSETLKI